MAKVFPIYSSLEDNTSSDYEVLNKQQDQCNSAIERIHHLENIEGVDVNMANRDLEYANDVLKVVGNEEELKMVESQEYHKELFPNRLRITKEALNLVISRLSNEIDNIKGSMEIKEVEENKEENKPIDNDEKQEELIKDDIKEQNLTAISMSTPNLIVATAKALGGVAGVQHSDNAKIVAATVDVAPIVASRCISDDNFNTKVDNVSTASSKPQQVIEFFNSQEGYNWLMGPKGQIYLGNIIKNNMDDFEIGRCSWSTYRNSISNEEIKLQVARETMAIANYQVHERDELETDEIEGNTFNTYSDLTENKDRISRLELLESEIAGVDNLIDGPMVPAPDTVETYVNTIDTINAPIKQELNVLEPMISEVTKEEMKYDTIGYLRGLRKDLVMLRDGLK